MKRILFFLLVVVTTQLLNAQSVGIGTTSPNASAMLDVISPLNNKGVLLPRMTTSQRFAISNPANGLLVYDTDFKEFYHHNGTAWRTLLNSLIWTPSPTRKWLYNFSDSIGIGTSTPDARLEVIGNVKTSARIDAGGVVEAAGLSSTGSLFINSTSLLQGAVTGSASAIFSSIITSNEGMVINDPTGTLQFKSSNTDKGFVQLSGDDLRLGTNSSNALGKFIVRTGGVNNLTVTSDGNAGIGTETPVARLHINSGSSNTALRLQADGAPSLQFYSGNSSIGSIQGTGSNLRIISPGNFVGINDVLYADDASNRVGIGTSSPTAKLHVNGNMVVNGNATIDDGRITSAVTGPAYNMLPLAYGKVSGNGNKISGTDNFTSANRVGVGNYNIFVTGSNASSVLMLSAERVCVFRVFYQAPGWYKLWVWDPILDEYADAYFQFVMYSP